jgi:uncharacterized protein
LREPALKENFMYAQTIPFLVHNLNATSAFLKKAEAHCDAKKIDKAVMLGMRLAPDMFDLRRQVMLVTDFAKGAGARLSGTAIPSYADEETTFEQLQARLTKTIDFLNGLPKSAFDGAETREVTMKVRGQEMKLSGLDYFYAAAQPNFYFHMATAYNILRHNGVELGKGDFLLRG